MSLLLDALKRAELAKQRQQAGENEITLPVTQRTDDATGGTVATQRVPGDAAQARSSEETRPVETTPARAAQDRTTQDRVQDAGGLETTPPRASEETRGFETTQPRSGYPGSGLETTQPPVITKDRLPPLDQPMDIVAEPMTPRSPGRNELRLEETVPPAPGPTVMGESPRALRGVAIEQASPRTTNKPWEAPPGERDAARQVFEAKQMDYNPRRPFYFTLGLLGVVALGAGIYFWWEMQPHTSFVAGANPPAAASQTAVSAPPAPVSAPPAQIAAAAPDSARGPAGGPSDNMSGPSASTPAPPSGGSTAGASSPAPDATPSAEASGRIKTPPAPSDVTARVQPSMGVVNPLAPRDEGAAAGQVAAPSSGTGPARAGPAATVPPAAAIPPASAQKPAAAQRPATSTAPARLAQAAPPAAPAAGAAQPAVPAGTPHAPAASEVAAPAPPSGFPAHPPVRRPRTSEAPANPSRPASLAPAAVAAPATAQSDSLAAVEPSKPVVRITPSEQRLDPNVEAAYAAFNAGKLDVARQDYQRALAADGLNRDALLGLAALDVRAHDYESAAARYQRVLDLDPRDPMAQAGLLGLHTNVDPVQAESHVKTLLASQPDAPMLEFALGNQYAAQARWPEAQEAYFKAYTGDPENPDFAFNLAVSLDQLRQPKPALEYYQRALALAQKRQAAFDHDMAVNRVRELSR